MPEYRRAFAPGGTFFFTLVTARRRPILTTPAAREALRTALADAADQRPFTIDAIVLLPDHLHCIWTLPPGDADFSTRWRIIKSMATRRFLAAGGSEAYRSDSRARHSERGVWQRRLWEHTIRDEAAFAGLCDYIHYNPVRHGLVRCPHLWPYSSFARFVRDSRYERTWNCICDQPRPPSDFGDVEAFVGEM
jgi:putative transposase